MLTYHPCNADFRSVAQRVVTIARQTGEIVEVEFNGIKVTATPGSDETSLVSSFLAEHQRLRSAHLSSTERNETEQVQQQYDRLMRRLQHLDFADDVAVLDWLCELEPISSKFCVAIQVGVILDAFARHGYYPHDNPDRFDEEDRGSSMHKLVGQALVYLKNVGAILQVFNVFVEDWKRKFVLAA